MKKTVNYLLVFIMLGFDFFYIINDLRIGNNDRILTYFALPLVLLVPYLLEKVTKKELNSNLESVKNFV